MERACFKNCINRYINSKSYVPKPHFQNLTFKNSVPKLHFRNITFEVSLAPSELIFLFAFFLFKSKLQKSRFNKKMFLEEPCVAHVFPIPSPGWLAGWLAALVFVWLSDLLAGCLGGCAAPSIARFSI